MVAAAVDGPTLRGWLGAELAGRLEAQWGELRAESELLRKCLEGHNKSNPRAFEAFLKNSRHAHAL